MIDTHCHLTYPGLHEQVDRVVADAHAAGVDRMISVGTTPADAAKARALSARFPGVYFAAGLHPHYAEQYPDRAALLDALRDHLADPRCVAVGEMGLDRHYPDPPIDVQRRVLQWQLELAQEDPFREKPVIIHNREATDDTLAMLKDSSVLPARFVFHCFTGSAAELEQILDFGAHISLTGIVTFSSARDLAAASDAVPLDRLMIETDSPYLAPEPHRKARPNQPKYVVHIAELLAKRRGMSLAEFTTAVDANAEQFFNL